MVVKLLWIETGGIKLNKENLNMKIGISINIDVTKIDKTRLHRGKKGTYLDLTTFIDTENKDQYDHNGFVRQSVKKEEREQNIQTPILGNCKVFYKKEDQAVQDNQDRVPYGIGNEIPF